MNIDVRIRRVIVQAYVVAPSRVKVKRKGAGRRGGKRSSARVSRSGRGPAVSYARGSTIRIHSNASLHTPTTNVFSAHREYMERAEAEPRVLHDAEFERSEERWSVYISPTTNESADVVARAATDELVKRWGVDREEVYAVAHRNNERSGEHVHLIVPARPGMELTRDRMRALGRAVIRELELDRALERTRPKGSAWNDAPTGKQMQALTVLAKGREIPSGMTRGDASLLLERWGADHSWFEGGRDGGRDR